MTARADATWLYAVQLSATVQSSPPQITLSWPPDQYGANSYTVYRKLKNDASWGAGTVLDGSAPTFTDTSVSVGIAYEYQVVKAAVLGYTGYGYIYTGVQAPLIESRGTLVLVVAADTGALANELARLQSDLAGDGWVVIRHDVSPSDSPDSVRNLIRNDYYSSAGQVNAVFLFGHVPVVMSGSLNYDSHGARALPADGFYGDMDGDWQLYLDPTNRPSYMPSDIELMVGRVDFYDLPGNGAPWPWPSETELLRQYLNKDHNWRHKLFSVPRRALMANRVGDYFGQAYAASGYRNFQAFVGPGNIVEANIGDLAPPEERWITYASSGAWLCSFACGAGQDASISQMGVHGDYHDVWSTDIVAQDAKAVFSMFMGSHFGDWSRTDNIMRAMLAAPSVTLTACLVGLPHWYIHHMGLGEPIGYGTRLTMNNSTLYQNQTNVLARGVLINLLGDPTLRLDQVAPPSGLSVSTANNSSTLTWSASPDANIGYYVYRAALPGGPFARLTGAPVAGTSFTDSAPFAFATRTYMVRALALQTTPSGSYTNVSQGIFLTGDGSSSGSPASAVTVTAKLTAAGIQLAWASQPGAAYHVEAKVLIGNNDWINLSGRILANGATTSYTDPGWVWYATRWYRVVSE